MHAIEAAVFAISFSLCALAHRDSAYFHSADDGFNFGRNQWMKKICDDVLISDLALPGTHDSAAYEGYGGDKVSTQCIGFDHQLRAGIRVFDIRIRHIENVFTLHHDMVYLHVNFDDFLQEIKSFLTSNPSETVLFRLKKEYKDGHKVTRSMRATLESYLKTYSEWYLKTTDTKVKLGQARGKFIILVDDSNFYGLGISYSNLNIQDYYNLDHNWDLYLKWERVKGHISNSAYGNKQTWFMNYLSGSGEKLNPYPYFVASGHSNPATGAARLATGRTTPGWSSWEDFPRVDCVWLFVDVCTIAFEGTNILARDRIKELNRNRHGSRTVGIIMADYPGDSLIEEIIDNNWRNCKK